MLSQMFKPWKGIILAKNGSEVVRIMLDFCDDFIRKLVENNYVFES